MLNLNATAHDLFQQDSDVLEALPLLLEGDAVQETEYGRQGVIRSIGANPYAQDNELYAYVEGVWTSGGFKGFKWADYYRADQLIPVQAVS